MSTILNACSGRKANNPDVTGGTLIEISDDDPSLAQILLPSLQYYFPQQGQQFYGPYKRMILKTLKGDALVILKTAASSYNTNLCRIKVFVNYSIHEPNDLLLEAMQLASHRWDEIIFKGRIYSLNSLVAQLRK